MWRVADTKGLVCALALLALAAGGSGCESHLYPEPYYFAADLQVNWGIDGFEDPADCASFGIDLWRASADGPERRESTVDCRSDHWSSLSDFFAMSEGTYRIAVQAVRSGAVIAMQAVDYDLIDTGGVQSIFFDFRPEDFGTAVIVTPAQ